MPGIAVTNVLVSTLSNNGRRSLCAVIFQRVRIMFAHDGNKLSSAGVAAGISLLAMRC